MSGRAWGSTPQHALGRAAGGVHDGAPPTPLPPSFISSAATDTQKGQDMNEDAQRVMELRQQGRSYQDIAVELGITPATALEHFQDGLKTVTENQ